MRAEGDAVFGQLAQLGQRHDLKAAAIGQDRAGPAHEFVQAAEPRHPFGAGPQHQVIGVAEDDVGAGSRTWSGYIALTVPAVPTGMKAGVLISPRGMAMRAAPGRAVGGEKGEAEKSRHARPPGNSSEASP